MDSPPAEPADDARAELLRLLQRYVVEAVRLGRTFAVRHHMHPTDWSALLAVIQGDRVGRPLTPGELGQRLGISSGATTAVVDRLERAGSPLPAARAGETGDLGDRLLALVAEARESGLDPELALRDAVRRVSS